ncbi:hypothetical protein J437_LFUL015229, partial [Ladona fulva]
CSVVNVAWSFQKKGGNVKTIPPYKPIPPENASPESSPEKFNPSLHHHSQTSQHHPPPSSSSSTSSSSSSHHHSSLESSRAPKRKGSKGSSTYSTPASGTQSGGAQGSGSTSTSTPVGSGMRSSAPKGPNATPSGSGGSTDISPNNESSGGAVDVPAKIPHTTANSGTPLSSRDSSSAKFTTSNFTETVVTPSESIFGAVAGGSSASNTSLTPASEMQQLRGKKRRGGGTLTPTGSIQSDSEPSSSSTLSGMTAGPAADIVIGEGSAIMNALSVDSSETERKYSKVDGAQVPGSEQSVPAPNESPGGSGSHMGVIAGPGQEGNYSVGPLSGTTGQSVNQSSRVPSTVVMSTSGAMASSSHSSPGAAAEERNASLGDLGKKSRFVALTCYICEEQGKGGRASVGACMQCNKSGCRQQFHVTCAQALGLLCEEAGNYLDNVKYCGYCQHHYSKLVRGSGGGAAPARGGGRAKGRCELCPSKDGALKRTDNSGWAHVVCALYIPEVRFGNVTTMEPILLQHVPNERFNK